jgi:chaperonin cofactor prefoldin
VRNREGQIHRLELVLRQRSERIDELTGKVARLRDQNRKLDEENDRLAEMVRLSPDPF